MVACSHISNNNDDELQDIDRNELLFVVVPILDVIKRTVLNVGGPLEVPPKDKSRERAPTAKRLTSPQASASGGRDTKCEMGEPQTMGSVEWTTE